jgi:hypothetical protein
MHTKSQININMTLPASGPLSLAEVNTELFRNSTAAITMNDAEVRTLAGRVGAGTAISFGDLRGKTYILLVFNSSDSFTLRTFTTGIRQNLIQFQSDGQITRVNVTSGTVETNSVLGPFAYLYPWGGTNGVGYRVRLVISQLFGRGPTNNALTATLKFFDVNAAEVTYTAPGTTAWVNVPSTQWIELSLASTFFNNPSYAFASGTVEVQNTASGATISRAFTLENGANPVPQFNNNNNIVAYGTGWQSYAGFVLEATGSITVLAQGLLPPTPTAYTDSQQPNLGSMFEARLVNYRVDVNGSAYGSLLGINLDTIPQNQLVAFTSWVNLAVSPVTQIAPSQGDSVTATGIVQIRKITSGAVISRNFSIYSEIPFSSLLFQRTTPGGDPIEFIYQSARYYGADGQFTFQTDGSITILGTQFGDPDPTGPSGFCTPEATAGVGEDYQVRIRVTQGGTDGTFNGVSFQIGPQGSQVGVNPFGVNSAYYTINQNILINFANVGPFGEYSAYGDIDVRKISTNAVQTVSFYITLFDENP